MKTVRIKDEYTDDQYVRRSIHISSINRLIHEVLEPIDFEKDSVVISKGNAQIRIPEKDYQCLRDDVKTALREESIPPTTNKNADERWVKENYWVNCEAYIFNFRIVTVQIRVIWGYDGVEKAREEESFLRFKHPFISEFIGCNENTWGKSEEEVVKIKKYLKA